jgi:plastocyanin
MHFRRLRVGGLTIVAFATLTLSDTRPAARQPSVIRGRVGIGVPVTARRPTAEYSRSVSLAERAPVSELRHVVVYLRDAPRAGAPAPVRAEIRQRHEHFVPRVVAVPVGSEVEFPNDDGFYHNVFSLSRVKSFNLGRYPQGASRRVRFDKPGVVKVFCEIHSHMTATVMVFDHPWYTIPNDDVHAAGGACRRAPGDRVARAPWRYHASRARRTGTSGSG